VPKATGKLPKKLKGRGVTVKENFNFFCWQLMEFRRLFFMLHRRSRPRIGSSFNPTVNLAYLDYILDRKKLAKG